MALEPMSGGSDLVLATLLGRLTTLDEFTAAWERGQSPAKIEDTWGVSAS